MNYCDIYYDNAMTSTMTLRIGGLQQQQHGTRMTRIGRIFTDIHYPCASASSVFYRTNAIFDDDNKPQMNADERRYFLASEFSKIIHCKERKAHQTISFGIRKTTEGTEDTEKRNKPLCSGIKINNELVRTPYELTPQEFVSVRFSSLFFSCSFMSHSSWPTLCSPWLNNLSGIKYGGFNARALEYSIFTQGETIEGVTLV